MADELERYLTGKLADELDRRGFIRLGATTAGMLALAACGGQTSTGGGGNAPSGPEFKIGVVLPYSKTYALLGESITNGMMLYFDKVGNQAGNRKISIRKEDEEAGDPQIPLTKTRKLVEQDQVDMVVGYVQSPAATIARDYLDQTKIPTIVANAGANVLSRAKKSPYIYRTSFSNWQPSHPMGKYIADNIGKKVTLVYSNYSAGTESVGSFKETFVPAGGQVLAEVAPPFPNASGDFSSFIAQIQRSNPDAIYVFMSGSDAANFLKQAAQVQLFKTIKVSGSGFFVEQDVLGAIGDAAPVGAITGLHWALTLDSKENKDFTADYKKKYAKQADVFAVQGYDTARVIVDALNAVKGDTGNKEGFLKAIGNVRFKSPRGDFKFDSASNNVVNTVYIRELVKDPQLGYTNKVKSSVAGVTDPGK
jgi:branched-chain amino acid transport system substrate-binding protein